MMLRSETVCLGCQSGLARALFQTETDRPAPLLGAARPIRRGQLVHFRSQGETIVGKLFLPRSPRRAPVVILCHGAGEWKESYFEMSEYLAERGVGSLALDLRGHGQSGGARFCVEMRQWIADIRAALDYLTTHPRVDGERLAAFGFASGGTAAIETALVDPRLRALVLLEATVSNSLSFPLTLLLKILLPLGRLKLRRTNQRLRLPLAKLRRQSLASDPAINRRIVSNPFSLEAFQAFPLPGAEQVFFVDTLKRVPHIGIPTMVLWGQDDRLAPPKCGRRLFDTLTCKKQLHIVAGNGYLGHLDRHRARVFDLTADWVLEHLTSEAGEAGAEQKANEQTLSYDHAKD
jgi:uncharacterized protein